MAVAYFCHNPCASFQACANAESTGKKAWVGLMYDRLVRSMWANRAAHNEARLFYITVLLACIAHVLPQADFDIPKRCTYKDTEVYDQAVTEYEKISASQGRGKESSKGGHWQGKESSKGGKGKGNDKSGGKAKVHAASCQAGSCNNVAVSCHDVCLCRERVIKIMGSASMTTTRVRPLRGKQPSYPLSWPS